MMSNVKRYFTELIQIPSVSGKETAILTYIKKTSNEIKNRI